MNQCSIRQRQLRSVANSAARALKQRLARPDAGIIRITARRWLQCGQIEGDVIELPVTEFWHPTGGGLHTGNLRTTAVFLRKHTGSNAKVVNHSLRTLQA